MGEEEANQGVPEEVFEGDVHFLLIRLGRKSFRGKK